MGRESNFQDGFCKASKHAMTIRQHALCSQVAVYGQISSLAAVLGVFRGEWHHNSAQRQEIRTRCVDVVSPI